MCYPLYVSIHYIGVQSEGVHSEYIQDFLRMSRSSSPDGLRSLREPAENEPETLRTSCGELDGEGPSTVDLAYQLLAVSHRLMRISKHGMGDMNLSIPRVQVLLAVSERSLRLGDHLRMRDLAEEFAVTPRNITTIVDGLEREGLLVRRRDPSDRRAIWLELTPLGVASIERVHQLEKDISNQFFAPLDVEQCRHLAALLQALCCERKPAAPASRITRRPPFAASSRPVLAVPDVIPSGDE
jgi:DNA-binding MarR family transcriptional regulator